MVCEKCGASELNIVKRHDLIYMVEYLMCIKCGKVYYEDLPDLKDIVPRRKGKKREIANKNANKRKTRTGSKSIR